MICLLCFLTVGAIPNVDSSAATLTGIGWGVTVSRLSQQCTSHPGDRQREPRSHVSRSKKEALRARGGLAERRRLLPAQVPRVGLAGPPPRHRGGAAEARAQRGALDGEGLRVRRPRHRCGARGALPPRGRDARGGAVTALRCRCARAHESRRHCLRRRARGHRRVRCVGAHASRGERLAHALRHRKRCAFSGSMCVGVPWVRIWVVLINQPLGGSNSVAGGGGQDGPSTLWILTPAGSANLVLRPGWPLS